MIEINQSSKSINHQNVWRVGIFFSERYSQTDDIGMKLLMAEILHHLGCMKPYKQWDKLPINWCRISSINRRNLKFASEDGSFFLLRNGLKGLQLEN